MDVLGGRGGRGAGRGAAAGAAAGGAGLRAAAPPGRLRRRVTLNIAPADHMLNLRLGTVNTGIYCCDDSQTAPELDRLTHRRT